jgi:deoxyguanosine kinase
MRRFFLAIEGVIGVGKTTLARLLQPRFGAELVLEAFEENPFLSDFYADRTRYAFQTQMFFLLSRYRQQQAIPTLLARRPIIADYAFAKDSLFARMNLAGDEWDVYEQLYNVLADRNPVPDLVVYLRADTDLLMMRIAMRDRAYEREMDRAYIESLRQVYERFFADYTRTPLLIINAKDLDYVQDQGALAFIEGQVRTALGIGVYQQTLPQMESAGSAMEEEAPSPLAEATGSSSEWIAVEEFLAANAALGQLGAILAGGTSGWSGSLRVEMRSALDDALQRLRRVTQVIEEG